MIHTCYSTCDEICRLCWHTDWAVFCCPYRTRMAMWEHCSQMKNNHFSKRIWEEGGIWRRVWLLVAAVVLSAVFCVQGKRLATLTHQAGSCAPRGLLSPPLLQTATVWLWWGCLFLTPWTPHPSETCQQRHFNADMLLGHRPVGRGTLVQTCYLGTDLPAEAL